MSSSIPPLGETLSVEQDRKLIEICDRFDQAQRQGDTPKIEDYLTEVDADERSKLLFDLISMEREWRSELGRTPSRAEYRERFPNDLSSIEAAFGDETEPCEKLGNEEHAQRIDDGREILIGLLAVQNGFVDHNAIINAIRIQSKEKSLTLTRILKDQGKLDDARLALLNALADEHIKQHGDIDASVASLKRVGSTDLDIDDPDRTVGPSDLLKSDADPPTKIQEHQYSIVRHHARGNLGVVYLAKDQKFGREVAIKRIRPDHAGNEESRYRFVLEAEITANLEHPCIVPIYDLGNLADGRPFYAMRFIRGMTMKGAVKKLHREGGLKNRVELLQLLKRFASICEAVAYAHNRGVIHRDIKPANIMLGPYGETLVVDFGLAKPIGRQEGENPLAEGTLHPPSASGSNSNLSQRGYVKGTPAFMSAEQATPELTDALTPAGDIYSLGATLYYILVCKAPYSGSNVGEILKQVREGKYKPLREINPKVPKPLESICTKAMRVRPEDRYPSALDLARDIERWIADEPVSAHQESRLERLGRFARRNKPVVAAASALCLTAFCMLGWHDLMINQERKRAEFNFEIARDAVRKIRSDLAQGNIEGAPVGFGLRLHFANEAARYLEKLLEQNPADASIRVEAAELFREKANLLRAFGRADEADSWYVKTIELYQGLTLQNPTDPKLAAELVLTLIDAGENIRLQSNHKEAAERFRLAAETAGRLLAEDGGNFGHRRALAQALAYLARARRELLKPDVASSQKAVDLLRPAPGAVRIFVDDRLLFAEALRIHGGGVQDEHRFDDAENAFNEAIAIGTGFDADLRRAVFHMGAYRPELMRNEFEAVAARALWDLARLLSSRERKAEALSQADRLIERLNRLRVLKEKEAYAESTMAEAYLFKAEIHAALGKKDEARLDLTTLTELLDKSRPNLKDGPRGRNLKDRIEKARRGIDFGP